MCVYAWRETVTNGAPGGMDDVSKYCNVFTGDDPSKGCLVIKWLFH